GWTTPRPDDPRVRCGWTCDVPAERPEQTPAALGPASPVRGGGPQRKTGAPRRGPPGAGERRPPREGYDMDTRTELERQLDAPIDVYPVGWLAAWQRRHIPRPRGHCHPLHRELRYVLRHASRGRWRAVRNTFNGYLA